MTMADSDDVELRHKGESLELQPSQKSQSTTVAVIKIILILFMSRKRNYSPHYD